MLIGFCNQHAQKCMTRDPEHGDHAALTRQAKRDMDMGRADIDYWVEDSGLKG